jgi:hypothetical protein
MASEVLRVEEGVGVLTVTLAGVENATPSVRRRSGR